MAGGTMWYSVPTGAAHRFYLNGGEKLTVNNYVGISNSSPIAIYQLVILRLVVVMAQYQLVKTMVLVDQDIFILDIIVRLQCVSVIGETQTHQEHL